MIKCEYCDNEYEDTIPDLNCKSCGAKFNKLLKPKPKSQNTYVLYADYIAEQIDKYYVHKQGTFR